MYITTACQPFLLIYCSNFLCEPIFHDTIVSQHQRNSKTSHPTLLGPQTASGTIIYTVPVNIYLVVSFDGIINVLLRIELLKYSYINVRYIRTL